MSVIKLKVKHPKVRKPVAPPAKRHKTKRDYVRKKKHEKALD